MQLAQKLGIETPQLERLRLRYRKEHGKEGEAKLEVWLRRTWEEQRDKVSLMGKSGGYVEHRAGAMGASKKLDRGNLHHEPEAVFLSKADHERARERFEALRWREMQRREIKRLTTDLRDIAKRSDADLAQSVETLRRAVREAERAALAIAA